MGKIIGRTFPPVKKGKGTKQENKENENKEEDGE